MALTMDNRKFAEVFIRCHKGSTLTRGSTENFFIARIFVPIPCPENIMTCADKILAYSAPDTSVE